MIPLSTIIRIARPTDNLEKIAHMYIDGLGFQELASFKNHQGFDGVIIGHPIAKLSIGVYPSCEQ